MPLRLVFCGTPEFAVPSLRAMLHAGHDVRLVITQPDRPAGRKLEMQMPPVKRLAMEQGLPVTQPERIKDNQELRSALEDIQPDAIVVVAYGRIIPGWMLELPRLGNINVHGSLLPKYRGAAPVQWAVANGETVTGVSTMRLDAGLDTGDVFLERELHIGTDMTAAELLPELAALGARALIDTLAGLEQGSLQARPQNHAEATLAPILTREDGRLLLRTHTAQQAYHRWRGFYPWPGAHAVFRGKRFLVHRMHLRMEHAGEVLSPGSLHASSTELLAGAADGSLLVLDEVQLEGKPRMKGGSFAKDFQLRPGERLE